MRKKHSIETFVSMDHLKSVGIVHYACWNVEPLLLPVKQVCSLIHHAIKVTELVRLSLIQHYESNHIEKVYFNFFRQTYATPGETY